MLPEPPVLEFAGSCAPPPPPEPPDIPLQYVPVSSYAPAPPPPLEVIVVKPEPDIEELLPEFPLAVDLRTVPD